MVSKNNRAKQMENVAERQPHFSIRKLTIGAASVLLSTTLWMSVNTSSVHAENIDNSDNDAHEATESNTETPSINDDTKVVVESNSNITSSNDVNAGNNGAETNDTNNEVTASEDTSKGLTVDNKDASVQSTVKSSDEVKKSESTEQKSAKTAQNSTLNNNTVNTEKAESNVAAKSNADTAKSTQQSSAASSANQVSSNADLTQNQAINSTTQVEANNSTNDKKANNDTADLSNIGLKGIETNKIPETTDLPVSELIKSYNNNSNSNEVNVNQVSGLRAAQLFAASFIATQNTGTGNNGAVNIDTYKPDFNLTENPAYQQYFAAIPADQYAFQSYEVVSTGQKIVVTTDRNNIGNNIRFYNVRNGSAQLVYQMTRDTQTNASGSVVKNRPSLQGTFTTAGVASNSTYKGGTYNWSLNQTDTVNFPGIGNLKIGRIDITAGSSNSPVDNGTGAFVTDNSHRITPTWDQGLPIEGIVSGKTWNSAGSNIPDKVTQNIWYVDAETGKVLSHKTSDEAFNGSSYDSTDNGVKTISKDGKAYQLIDRGSDGLYDPSDFSDILNKQLATNNGLPITIGDVLSTPLKGTLRDGRIGNIKGSITNFQGTRAYMRLQTKTDGTIDLNTYTFDPGSTRGNLNTGLSQADVAPGQTVMGAGDTSGSGAFYNGTRPGNRDIIFLYNAEANKQNANITFVNDDTGASLSPQQNSSGDAGSQITFDNAGTTVTNLISQGYVYNGTTGNGVTNGSAGGSFTSVGFPAYDNDDNTNQAFVVHFKNPVQTTTYRQGTEESKTINRTINYYDKVTGEKIPSNLISQNPVTDSVTFTRTQVLDQDGKVVGYGTISTDGKSFRNQDWHTAAGESSTQFDAKRSSDLSAYNYTAPEFQDGTNASIVAAHEVTPTTQDLVYNVYYGHQTQQVTTNEDVTRRFHYIFTDGTTPESHLTPQADQKVTFTGTATKDLVTGKTGDTVWTPSTGTLAQVAGQTVAGYHITGNVNANADGSANAVTVNPDSGDIDVTVVYTPDAKTPDTPQKAKVTIYDKTENNKQLSNFENNNGTKGSAISFDGEPQTLQAYLNSGYVFDSATDANGNSIGTASNITFGNFDSVDGNVQSFNIYLVHGTDTKTEKATTNAHVHYVVAGNEANKPAAPADSPTQTINWTRTNTTDKVTGATTEGTWTPDKNGFTSVTSPDLTNYTPDQAVANFTTPQPNRDQVVTVVYNPNPEVAQKADLVVYDKTDNNKELNNFDNSGKTGTQISFSGSANYVADLIAKGYKIDSFVNDQNQTSNPTSYDQISFSNFDNNSASDQHFKLYLVHDTENVTDKKTTTSTVHYVVSDGKTNPPSDNTQTITWTRPGTKDKVTGVTTPTGNWTTPDNYTDVPTPNLDGYTPDKTNVPAPTPDPNQNPTTVVTYNPKTPEAPTYTGTTENKTVTRTINYYDKVTGEKIPANLISDNPTTQNVTLSRTHVVSSTGQDMGYGTVSADGKTFTKATTVDGWNTGDWAQVTSPDLSNAGYTAPDLAQADQVTVDANTKDAVVNVYYGHQTEVITPKTPHNPGGSINPNDPRNKPSVYPDGLTKEALTTEVTRHINYVGVNEDGTTTPVNGSPDGKNTYTQTVSFERNAVIDKVTGQILGYSTDGTTNVTITDKDRAWTPTTQNMDSVASKTPSEVGYDKVDISTVGGVTVYPGQKINDVTVTYTKNKSPEVTQKATLEIIDNNDTNAPKQLASFSNEGKSEDQINFANSNEILQSYLSQGYKVQKTAGNLSGDAQSGYTYPTYGNTTQDFKIYLIHDIADKTETATATAQVHYVVADNGVQAPADSDLQTITYTRTNRVDKVTGATVNEGTWQADKSVFTDVKSPDLSKDGYTPSLENVQFNAPERNVNQRVTVVYNRSAQAADLQIIDDNDPQNQRVLATYSAGGESGKQISFDGSNTQLQTYLNNGYTFEKYEGQGMSGDAQNGFTYPSFDNDSQSNQSFKIYLKHATANKTATATTTAHVHYIMADGTKAPDDSAIQTINWTQTNTVDRVTGATINEGTWSSDKNAFTDVDSPTVTGYTPGTKTVKFATPERGVNQVVNVVYTKDAPTPDRQNALVVYQDVNDPAHPVDLGQSDQLTGQAGYSINYSTANKIDEYEKQGYVLVSNGFDANGTKPSFDNVNGNTQTFYVTFKHGIQPVTPTTPGTPDQPINPDNPDGPKYPSGTDQTSLTKDVTRTVTYEGAGNQTPSPVTDTLHFQGTGYLDKVTGKWTDANGKKLSDQTKGITWTITDGTKDEGSFNLVPTKHIDGYTSKVVTNGADDGNGNVKSYTGITHTSDNINVVVQYNPIVAEQGNLIVKFHDDTDNKDLTGVGTDTGTQDVGTQVTYNPSTDLTNLENKGYVYVSTDGNIPSSIVKGTTTVTIHVKHGTVPVTPDNPGTPDQPINPNDPDPNGPKYPTGTDKASIDKTITRIVHYEGADQYTPNDVKQPVHFTAKGVLDKVTGEWITPLAWSEDQTFNGVNSPKIPGYHVESVDKDTTDNQNVDSAKISHTGADYTVTVKYAKDAAPTPDATTGKVAYIDDTTKNTLRTDSLSGNVDANIDYTTQDKISNYINMGYKLVSNNFTDGKEIFNKDASKNSFEVHLVHDTVPVTPDNPGTPDKPINPNDPRPRSEQPKYPTGTSETDLTKDITRTVHYSGADEYTPNDVKQPVHFTAKGVLDKVTGEWITPLAWSEDQTFNGVNSPKIPGYHVVSVDKDADGTNVASSNVSHTGSDYTVNVVYAKDAVKQAENANLHIIDLSDNNKEIANFNDSGDDNAAINFNGAQTTVDALIKGGYKVNSIVQATSDPNNPTKYGTEYSSAASQWMFDDKPGVDQSFYVYVEHDYAPINPENAYGRTDLTQTVTETVHYIDEATNKPVATDYTNTLTFKGQGRVDKVTGKMLKIKSIENGQITYDYNVANEIDISSAKLSDFAWSTPTTLQKVTSPTIAGYTIDAAKTTPSELADGNDIKEIQNVAYDHGNVEATVYYKANPVETHKAGLTIYANGNQVGTASVTGAKDTAINFSSASDIVAAYISNGYKFDHAQDVTNNKEMTGKSYNELNFGNFATTNNSDQQFAIYLTKDETPAKTQQNAQLTVRDVTPGQEMDLGNYTQPGLEGDTISFSSAQEFVQNLLNKGYVWDGASYNGTNLEATNYAGINFGNYDNTDDKNGISQKWVINLVHGVTPVNPDHPDDKDGFTKDYLDRTITRDVTYVYEDGSQAAAPVHQEAHYQGSGYLDNVTGKWVTVENGKITGLAQGLTWTPDQDSTFDQIGAKNIEGYHVSSVSGNGISGFTVGQDGTVGQQTVTKDTPSSTIRVVYVKTPVTPVPANGSIVYIDDTTGNNLENATFGGTVGAKIDYTTADRISYYQGKGYKLVSNNFTDGSQTFKQGENKFEVHLTHVTETKDATKTITRDVTYVYEDGSQADTPVQQTITFTGKTTSDKVTGSEKTTWNNESQTFGATKAIDTTKYQIVGINERNTTANVDRDTGVVASETITPNSQNSAVVITLANKPETPIPANGSITYYDDTTGTTLESAGFSGSVGQKINYTTADRIINYVNKGYDVVSNNFTDGNETFKQGDNKFEVHLVHATTPITPENPGKPGQEVPNPNDPEHPHTIPANFVPQTLTHTVTRDVTYVYADGSQASAPVHQTFTFNGNGVIDLVTGQLVTVENGKITGAGKITWNADSHNFDAIDAIDHDGYYISNVSENNTTANVDTNTGAVAGETITPNSQNSTIIITLTKKPDVPTPVPEQGSIKVTVHDVKTNQDVPGYDKDSGKQNTGTSFTYDKTTTITDLENKGYKVINPNVDIPTKVSNIDQHIVIYVDHNVIPVTPDKPGNGLSENDLNKTVTETVHYVVNGGATEAPADKTTSLKFTGTAYYDSVTKKWTDANGNELSDQSKNVTWTAENGNKFAVVVTPTLEGYTPSVQSGYDDGNKNVKEINNITPDSGNVEVTVTYNKNNVPTPVKQGTIEIIYHDTTDNVDIPGYGQSRIKEDEGTSFSYNPNAKDLPALESKGYVLDGELPTIPTKFTDGDQRVVINVKHGTTTVTPDKPGKPGDPIDPNNPDGPKYPEGTGENNLKVTGTQTIHYIGAGDKTPKDNTQSFEFTKQITFDNVTGKIINDSGWNVTSHTFGSEATPVIDGYHADKTTAGGTTVTPNDLHKTVTVTYTPNVPAVPTPTPTPSPEPKPENTPVEPNTPTPTPDIPDNVTPTPEPKNNNVKPHGESIVQKNNDNPKVVSHGQSGNNWTAPHGQHVDQRGNIVTSDNRVVGYVDQNGKAHYTKLPQTGDDQTNDVAAALLGGAAVSLGLIGLAGVKKRRKEDK
ncbi:mucin-binding protein [Lactobacillus acidophilus]|uniref:mucin-binding protein n=1 Tax=Lactobacillus acidophilus TaxID=1579 RepID=UPI003F53B0F5